MRRFNGVARGLVLGALASVWAFTSGGCIIVTGNDGSSWNDSSTVKETRRFEIAAQPMSPINVRTENGSVDIDKAPQTSQVIVTATVRAKTEERLANTKVIAERDSAGAVKVYVEWPDGRRRDNEGATFEIQTPDAKGVDVDTSNGSIRIAGLGGEAKLVTSNGRISAVDHDGPVNARSSNGRLTFDRVRGDVVGRTSNGSINAHEISGMADLDTSNGSVDVRLADSSAGPVRVDTSNGGIDLECGPRFAGVMAMSTSNASVRFNDGTGKTIKARDHLDATVGSGGPRSTLSASNGSIDVRVVSGGGSRPANTGG